MPHPTDIHVGRIVRETRVARGLSQTELGERLGVSFQQVQKYEKGTNRMGASRLLATANILNVPVAALFEGLGEARPVQANGKPPSRRAIEIATIIDAMPAKKRAAFLTIVDFSETGRDGTPDAPAVMAESAGGRDRSGLTAASQSAARVA